MSSRIAVIAIDAVEPRPVADFWCAVLGWRVVEEEGGGVSAALRPGNELATMELGHDHAAVRVAAGFL